MKRIGMPKIVDHDLMRKELLSQCFHYFAYQGYRGVTMRSLAKALKISTGTLYHYFANKSDLFTQMLFLLAQDDIKQVTNRLEGDETQGQRFQVLLDFIEEKEEYFRKLIFLFCDLYRNVPEDLDSSSRDKAHQLMPEANSFFVRSVRIYSKAIDDHLGLSQKIGNLFISFIIGQLILKVVDPGQEAERQFSFWFKEVTSAEKPADNLVQLH